MANAQDKWWRGWFILEAYWKILHFVVLICVSLLWRPNNNNKRYAYSMQLDDQDRGNGVELPESLRGIAGIDGSMHENTSAEMVHVQLDDDDEPGKFTIDDRL